MGVDLLTPNADERLAAIGADNPITEISPDGFFSGALGATFVSGPVSGFASLAEMTMDAIGTSAKYQAASDYMTYSPNADLATFDKMLADRSPMPFEETVKAVKKWAAIDPRRVGGLGQIGGAVTRGVTLFGLGTLLGGPYAGAATVGGTEGYTTYNDLTEQGVDSGTALAAGATVGVTSGASAMLPASIGAKSVIGAAFSGAGVNVVAGGVSRGSISAVLDSNGYSQMADQYRVLDAQAIAADALLGSAFGAITRRSEIRAENMKATRDEIIAAFEARRMAQNERGTFGLPIDPIAAAKDAELSDRALASILTGKDFEIDGSEARAVVDGSIVDPQTVEMGQSYVKAMEEEFGDFADTSQPTPQQPAAPDRTGPKPKFTLDPRPLEDSAPAPEAPALEPVAPETAVTNPAEAFKDLNPMVAAQAAELLRSPDTMVEMYDGTVVSGDKLAEYIANNLNAANKDANLFDVAVACFLRTQ